MKALSRSVYRKVGCFWVMKLGLVACLEVMVVMAGLQLDRLLRLPAAAEMVGTFGRPGPLDKLRCKALLTSPGEGARRAAFFWFGSKMLYF